MGVGGATRLSRPAFFFPRGKDLRPGKRKYKIRGGRNFRGVGADARVRVGGGRGRVSGVGSRVWEGRARIRGGGAGGEESEKATGDGDITRELTRYVAESVRRRSSGRG